MINATELAAQFEAHGYPYLGVQSAQDLPEYAGVRPLVSFWDDSIQAVVFVFGADVLRAEIHAYARAEAATPNMTGIGLVALRWTDTGIGMVYPEDGE